MLCIAGTTNGSMLNHQVQWGSELMSHPYLELTNLGQIIENCIIDQKQATDCPLVMHSSKDHVAICPEVANISDELIYLHAALTDSTKVSARPA